MDRPGRVTLLLREADAGDRSALERLFPLVYDELQQIAHRQLRGENRPHTLCTTALVHEAYVKLVDQTKPPAQSRAHFFGASARAMRQILIDYARRRCAARRGGGAVQLSLDDDERSPEREIAVDACAESLLELDLALARLAQLNERLSRVVECRFFGGLSIDETAEVLQTSPRTIKRDSRKARAWLYDELVASKTNR